ncbi:MAG: hypothetical protein QME41_01200 [Actinomycetota bacterium]|nr:hypothetical protein [Actinomycetota bacterium]
MRFKVRALIAIILALLMIGCSSRVAKDQSLKIKVEGKFVEVYLPSEKEKPINPLFKAGDYQELDQLALDYYNFIRSGNRKAAVYLFLPDVRSTEDSIIAKDLELAQADPSSYQPTSNNYIWYQHDKLWPRKEAEMLKNDEVERLVILSSAYEKAVIIKTTFKKGNTRKVLAVKSNDKYYLLP